MSLFYNLSFVETDGIEGDRARKRNAKSVTLQHTKSVSLFYNLSLVAADGIEGDRTLVVTRRIRQTHPVGAS